MATTTATITLNSADITGDALSLNKTATLTKANSSTGLDQFTGITTVIYACVISVCCWPCSHHGSHGWHYF